MRKMQALSIIAAAIAATTLGACAAPNSMSGDYYSASDTGKAVSVQQATVIAVRAVTIQDPNSTFDQIAGGLGGAVLGAAVGNNVGGGIGHALALGGGAAGGAMGGSWLASKLGGHVPGYQITIQFPGSQHLQQAIVQQAEKGVTFAVGQQVLVTLVNGRERVEPLAAAPTPVAR